jgi:hypothetical protein
MKRSLVCGIVSLAFLFSFSSPAQAQDATAAPKADAAVKADAAAKAPASQPTVKEPTNVGEAVDTGKNIYHAFKGGKYREAVAAILMLLLFLWRRFASKFIIGKLSPWWVGFVAVLLGYIGSIPGALMAAKFSWLSFVWNGLLASAEAMLLWQLIGKKVLPKVFGEVKKEEPATK